MTPRRRRTVFAVPAGGSVADLATLLLDAASSWVDPAWEFEPAVGDRPAHLLVTSVGRIAERPPELRDLRALGAGDVAGWDDGAHRPLDDTAERVAEALSGEHDWHTRDPDGDADRLAV